jgi:hypothetical protein
VNRRLLGLAASLVCVTASPAYAQAPPTPPLVLTLPSSARTSALGNAWVAGRDAEVVFYNPAQLIGGRQEFGATVSKPGRAGTGISLASAYAGGRYSLTFGWGVRLLGLDVDAAAPYPYASDVLLTKGDAGGNSGLLAFGGAFVFKNFRIGGAGKYVFDHVVTPPAALLPVAIDQRAWLADVGVARTIFGGTAAFAVQNLGRTTAKTTSTLITPRQFVAGYSWSRSAGPLDVGLYGQVTMRKDWIAPAGGVEATYSWIEGYSFTMRAGAMRPDTTSEMPIAIGAGFTADRLTLELALRFFDGGQTGSMVTVRWR